MTTSIRVGYAGYQWDGSINISDSTRNYSGAMAGLYHVRHRAYDPELGRWTRRDPIGYVDGMGLYEYVGAKVVSLRDPTGLIWWMCGADTNNTFPTQYRGKCGPSIESWLTETMQRNGADYPITHIQAPPLWWLPDWLPDPTRRDICNFYAGVEGIQTRISALKRFIDLVKPGGDWDFKRSESFTTSQCPKCCTQTVTICGTCFNYDVPGNIHYGYVAKKAGFSDELILFAPNCVQEGGGPDDPADRIAIQIGIDLANGTIPNICSRIPSRDPSGMTPDISGLNQLNTSRCEPCGSSYSSSPRNSNMPQGQLRSPAPELY